MKQLFVIKIGGNVIDNPLALQRFLKDFSSVKSLKILVHGGGKIATEVGNRLGVEAKMVDGRRITDQSMLEVVTMVYGGLVNKNIVALLQSYQCNAIGLTGADGNIMPAVKRKVEKIDYGFVGDVDGSKFNISGIKLFVGHGMVPVIAPLTHDGYGTMLNTNADTIASSLAVTLSGEYETRLVYCFEKRGVLASVEDDNSVIHEISFARYQELKSTGIISRGMIPKMDNSFDAIKAGVKSVTICHSEELLSSLNDSSFGTTLKW